MNIGQQTIRLELYQDTTYWFPHLTHTNITPSHHQHFISREVKYAHGIYKDGEIIAIYPTTCFCTIPFNDEYSYLASCLSCKSAPTSIFFRITKYFLVRGVKLLLRERSSITSFDINYAIFFIKQTFKKIPQHQHCLVKVNLT